MKPESTLSQQALLVPYPLLSTAAVTTTITSGTPEKETSYLKGLFINKFLLLVYIIFIIVVLVK